MSLDVALDVGTSMTRLATVERGVVVNESTVVAIDTNTGDIVDLGEASWRAVARDPRHIVNFHPLANGTTEDFDVAARLLKAVFDRANFGRMQRLKVTMSIPVLATSIERRALRQAALQAGATEVTLLEAPLAAAMGARLALEEPVASAVVMLGGGASETALMSIGGIVVKGSVRVGGTHFDAAIATLIRQRFGVVVSPAIAESLKVSLASPIGSLQGQSLVVPGRTVDRGQPVNVEVPASLVDDAISDHFRSIVRSIKECLSEAPPDLAQDVAMRGLTLVGGLARLHDMPEALSRELGVAVHLHDSPELVVVEGLRRSLTDMHRLHRLLRTVDA